MPDSEKTGKTKKARRHLGPLFKRQIREPEEAKEENEGEENELVIEHARALGSKVKLSKSSQASAK